MKEGIEAVRQLLISLGIPSSPGMEETPRRVLDAFREMTEGYREDLNDVVGNAVWPEPTEELVLVRDIEFFSLCEHHLLPFFGRAHVAYIPKGRIIGLSKIPRIVEHFCRRLQVQERLTQQIAKELSSRLQPQGVGVVIEAYHLCMMARGVKTPRGAVVTSSMQGLFLRDARARNELLQVLKNRPPLLP